MKPFLYLLFILSVANCKFLEAGFDDGPFYGKKIKINSKKILIKESISYRNGFLQFIEVKEFNPILAYSENGKIKWAFELSTKSMENTDLMEVYQLSVSNGIFRDKIQFIGNWTFGAERGTGYIWKYGELQYFYLSW